MKIQGDLMSLLLFFQNKESRLKMGILHYVDVWFSWGKPLGIYPLGRPR
jgi:hypothetical protein